jgi:SagB-type dehydrogenase family enzyme
VTCRNFDRSKPMSNADFTATLYRTFAARATSNEPGIDVIKRAVPSAGGLHPTEAYVFVQNVEGIAPGFYHYHPVEHALEPLTAIAPEDTQATALSPGSAISWMRMS